ncbi:hypothetical protein AMC99_01256 [Altererythrobacter epoxidivorans]|uniref:Uncharacterized protein n=1 Tax=Altererythrobacter epoxidivorans TaxID=361183 RepID=A0A0M4MVJ3_9SPHN|nr:hypothetical protein [Altererythrobacter epoxidivorans]ALE16550.1 hypothetical protein AMC99_01256 [Altererythrobacter epoxidivorans]
MDLLNLRSRARQFMALGAVAIIAGTGIMVHGEMNFGDGVLIAGIVLFILGAILLAQTPTGDSDAG